MSVITAVCIACFGLCACSDDGGSNPGLDSGPSSKLDSSNVPKGDGKVTPTPDSTVEKDSTSAGGVVVPATWIKVTAGEFTMGSPTNEKCRDADEKAHLVKLSQDFEISDKEVSQKQFHSLMGYNPSYHDSCGDDCPVEFVNWHEAAAYCNALSTAKGKQNCYSCSGSYDKTSCKLNDAQLSGKKIYDCTGYRLPTEAEWEFAARAGKTTPFYNGSISSCMTTDSNADKIAWYKVNSMGKTHKRGLKSANDLQLYDMSGNVYEWVDDWYGADMGSTKQTDPTGPASGTDKVFRGGAFYYNAEHARSANRERFDATKRFTFVGFRCARSL